MKLSATDGYCYAYYPYSSSASSITSIPVTAGGTDFMYATPVTVNDKDKDATLNMKHALAAIRFALKKGTYTGTGAVTSVEVASSALGSSGTLNAKTGDVTANGLGTAVSQSAGFNLETTAKNVDVIMVPSGNAGTITLSVTIDGKVYSTEVSSTTIKQGSCYTCTLTVNAGSLALSGVKIGDWGYDDIGAPVITAGGYTVTCSGNYTDLLFSSAVSEDGLVTITCKPLVDDAVPDSVSFVGKANLSQPLNGLARTINLLNIESDIVINFNGYSLLSPAVAPYWNWIESTGIYLVRPDNKPAHLNDSYDGNRFCIGVVLVDDYNCAIKLFIEKFECSNNPESTTLYATAAKQLDSTNKYSFSWGGDGTNTSITNNTQVGAGSTSNEGYLPMIADTYLGTPNLSTSLTAWQDNEGALRDFNGKSNSAVIQTITTNGSSSSTNAPMAYLINAFNAEDCPTSVNHGFQDWFVPSCGQLALLFYNRERLNKALMAIGGTPFSEANYWSSSEYSMYGAWSVNFSNGCVSGKYSKSNKRRVRLVRYP